MGTTLLVVELHSVEMLGQMMIWKGLERERSRTNHNAILVFAWSD
jgi:hypothetical protein